MTSARSANSETQRHDSHDWEKFLSTRAGTLPLAGRLSASLGVLKGACRDRCSKSAEFDTDVSRMTITAMISTPFCLPFNQ